MPLKVLLISTNREKSPFAVAPIGAAKVLAALQAAGYEADLLDLCFTRNMENAVKKRIQAFRPDLVGLSIRNLDNCAYIEPQGYFETDARVVRAVKKYSQAPIMIGGSGVSVAPKELADYLGVDYAFVGEGEKSLPAFLTAFENHQPFDGIPGLFFRNGFGWRGSSPDFAARMDELPFASHAAIDYKKYFARGGFLPVQTKRGCPFRCVYCSYGALEGRQPRLASPGRSVEEMARMVRDTGRSDFFFVDGVFNYPADHAAAICEEIVRRGLDIRWLAYCNPLGLDREMAGLFKAAGCAGIELGLDAAIGKMLQNLKKGFGQQEIRATYEALQTAGIPFAVFLLFGGPGETLEDWQETQKFLNDCGKANAVFASMGLRIYDHTPLFDIALKEGVIDPDAPLLAPRFYLSEHLPAASAARRLDELARREPTWSSPLDWNCLTVQFIQWLLAKFRVIPCWRDIENYGAHMRRRHRNSF